MSPSRSHTFLKSFLDLSDTNGAEKFSRSDPGARFSDFNMSYRLPWLRKYVTFYVDSIVHDDVTPPSAPRRASFRTGLYLSQIPGARKFDFRFEAMDTDPITSRSSAGSFNYYETIQRQAYTNQGMILGDWAGREGKGGQAFLTDHLSGKESVQAALHQQEERQGLHPRRLQPRHWNVQSAGWKHAKRRQGLGGQALQYPRSDRGKMPGTSSRSGRLCVWCQRRKPTIRGRSR